MIKLLKSGKWALQGTEPVDLTKGDTADFGAENNVDLVNAGWARWAKKAEETVTAESPAPEVEPEAEQESQSEVEQPNIGPAEES